MVKTGSVVARGTTVMRLHSCQGTQLQQTAPDFWPSHCLDIGLESRALAPVRELMVPKIRINGTMLDVVLDQLGSHQQMVKGLLFPGDGRQALRESLKEAVSLSGNVLDHQAGRIALCSAWRRFAGGAVVSGAFCLSPTLALSSFDTWVLASVAISASAWSAGSVPESGAAWAVVSVAAKGSLGRTSDQEPEVWIA